MKKILIIEDESGLQITLEDRLIAEGYEVTIEGNGISGEDRAIKDNFDLILLDIMLPGRDGFKVCENIRRVKVHTPIIMLTARNTDLDTVMGLRQGADDYLAKPFDMSVLIARIEAALRRSSLSNKSEIKEGKFSFGDFILDMDRGCLTQNEEEISLNAQEYRLLEFLIKNRGTVISRNELLDNVWGYDSESTSRTVDVHIAKLRNKMGESEIPKFIVTVRGRGYKFKI